MDVSPNPDAGSLPGLILFFFLLVLGGAYFAGSETALSGVNRIRMMTKADDGSRRAKKVLYILDHFDTALSTILIGNNIMHIGSASLATVTASRLWGAGAVPATTAVTTLTVFLLAEMLPKTIARACSERFALFCAPSMLVLMKVLKPVSLFFTWIGSLLSPKKEEEPTVTEEELHEIIENIGTDGGDVEKDTAELVQSALEFTETPAKDVFTPWASVTCLMEGSDPKTALEVITNTPHSRLPVVDAAGNVTGLLQIRKFLKAYITREGHVSLKKCTDKPFFVQAGRPIDELLETMSRAKTHAAVVVSETGAPVGLITVEDILEELVGEIYDEEEAAC